MHQRNCVGATQFSAGDTMIHLARWLPRSTSGVNGPGDRSVIWVQGCPLRCAGCFNPAFLEFDGGKPHVQEISSEQLARRVLAEHAKRPLEGVTFSGGEPMAQADGLAAVAARLRREGLSVVVFTGYTWSYLQSKATPAMQSLLDKTDLIVAGPYVARFKTPTPDMCGSSNQTIVYLTDRLKQPASSAHVELQVGDGGRVHMTGFPNEGLRQALGRALELDDQGASQ